MNQRFFCYRSLLAHVYLKMYSEFKLILYSCVQYPVTFQADEEPTAGASTEVCRFFLCPILLRNLDFLLQTAEKNSNVQL